jgi:hypothetical protein
MNRETKDKSLNILRLMTDDERMTFKTELGLNETASEEDIISNLLKIPRYEVVRLFINASDSTIVLLREIFEILESFGYFTRTTGCVFALANPSNRVEHSEIEFSQQTVNAVCNWSSKKSLKRLTESIEKLESTWNSFADTWHDLLDAATPRTNQEEMCITTWEVSGQIIFPPWEIVDEDAQSVLFYFYNKANRLAQHLKTIPTHLRPTELNTFIDGIHMLGEEIEDRTGSCGYVDENDTQQKAKFCIKSYVSDEFVQEFDKFLEDVYLLSDLVHGEGVVDMLQINLWSSRPQMFEIWVMLTLLRWLRSRGYAINFLKINDVNNNVPFRWELSYSKDSKPCAVIHDPEQKVDLFLFYQLYRSTGDMPDISVLEAADPMSESIWAVDPKHSERSSYSQDDYRKTAERYRDSFRSKHSIVVEYFDRDDLGTSNPLNFGNNAKLIRGCRPGAEGLGHLFTELAPYHPIKKYSLICIDFSSSFGTQRNIALENLRRQTTPEFIARIVPKIVGFAGNTVVMKNTLEWQRPLNESLKVPDELIDGTAAERLIQSISDLATQYPITDVIIITDGQFNIQLPCVTERINAIGNISVHFGLVGGKA